MHCNSRQPDAAQTLSALISSPVPSLNSLSLSVAVLERFCCLYVTLGCDLDTSWAIQNEILELSAHHILRQICNDIRFAGQFEIIVDATTDITCREQKA